MRRAVTLLLVAALLVGLAAPAAYAGGSTGTNVALGLASFAVFNQLVAPLLQQRQAYAEPVTRTVVYTTPAVVYSTPAVYAPAPVYVAAPVYAAPPPVVVAAAPPPPQPTVVQYPHGRYELRGDGVYHAYQWVWIPNLPPPPPPAPPAPAQ